MKYFLYLFLVIVLAAGCYAAWMWYGMTYPYQDFPQEGVFVDIPHGASPRLVGYLLEHDGVIRSKLAFEIYARRNPRGTLRAGEYFFDHPMTGGDVFWKIAGGQIYEQAFTLSEGETIMDIAIYMQDCHLRTSSPFLGERANRTNGPQVQRRVEEHRGFRCRRSDGRGRTNRGDNADRGKRPSHFEHGKPLCTAAHRDTRFACRTRNTQAGGAPHGGQRF